MTAEAEDGIRDPLWSRGLGDVYKRQVWYGYFLESPNTQKTFRLFFIL